MFEEGKTLLSPVYIAGGMRGYEELNYPNFMRVAAKLRSMGYEVINPAENFPPDPNITLEEALAVDLVGVQRSRSMVVLHRWRKSLGALIEATVATATGKPIFDEDDLDTPLKLYLSVGRGSVKIGAYL